MADVAQLVEPRIVIPVVAGSIPVIRPTYFNIFNNLQQHSFTIAVPLYILKYYRKHSICLLSRHTIKQPLLIISPELLKHP